MSKAPKATGMSFGNPKKDVAALSTWVGDAPPDNELASAPKDVSEAPDPIQLPDTPAPAVIPPTQASVPPPPPPAPTVRMVFDLDKTLHRKLRLRCFEQDVTMAEIMRGLVSNFVDDAPKKAKPKA